MIIPSKYGKKDFFHDLLTGAVIALVSIPISMGYASIAGLPLVCGLYGSILPVAVFALTTTSPRFVFGVDAAPAALTGGILASMGIAQESPQAISVVPFTALLAALWLLVFFILKADKILKYISDSVMGGFISGIGIEIILMQVPKLFGGNPGRGEIAELLVNIVQEAEKNFNLPSLLLAVFTIAIILGGKKLCPTIPLQAILMFAGAGFSYFFALDKYGIMKLPQVEAGLPIPGQALIKGEIPDLHLVANLLGPSLSIAVLILSETMLATSNSALKNGDKINNRREILAYSLSNMASALSGSCPVNGSISRTGIAGQLGVKSQIMLLSSALFMALILITAAPLIAFLPVPVLTAIVVSALIGTLEFSLARKFKKADKTEYIIFYAALISVLVLGTIYGAIVGVFLSSLNFIVREAKPITDFLGAIPGRQGYYSLKRRDSAAYPLKETVIYKFSGPLFYATIGTFCQEIEKALKEDSRIIICDASGMSCIDITACQRLVMLYKKFKVQGKLFYMTGHRAFINKQMKTFGAGLLIEEGAVKHKLALALEDAGLPHPFPIDTSWKMNFTPVDFKMSDKDWEEGKDFHS